jgi:Ca2+-binding RTX toxin-like protein
MLNRIIGTNENEILEGVGERNETFIGLGGDDILKGGHGNDIYIWDVGDGDDVVMDNSGNNVLTFGESVDKNSVRIERDDKHLYFVIGQERVKIENWFYSPGNQLIEIRFMADSTKWNRDYVNGIANSIIGTDNYDDLRGFDSNDTIIGLGGDDDLYGGGGHDRFIWNSGDGDDKILDATALDTLQLNVNSNLAYFERDEDNLYVVIGDERITVSGWFSDGNQLGYIFK